MLFMANDITIPEIITKFEVVNNKLVIHHNFTEDNKFIVDDVILNNEPVIVHNTHKIHFVLDDNVVLYVHNGVLYTAGWNLYGERGVGFYNEHNFNELYPVLVDSDVEVRINNINDNEFIFGSINTFMKYNGYLYATGANSQGQLGIGSKDDSNTFEKVRFADGDYVLSEHVSELIISENNDISMVYSNKRYAWGDGKHLYPTQINNINDSKTRQRTSPIVMESFMTKNIAKVVILLALLVVIYIFLAHKF